MDSDGYRTHIQGKPLPYPPLQRFMDEEFSCRDVYKRQDLIMAQEDVFKKIVSHCKEYGFVFPSSEIYDGLAAVYDYEMCIRDSSTTAAKIFLSFI